MGFEVRVCIMCLIVKESGKRDSNPRPSAWEADALPLSYSRISAVMAIGAGVIG
jgi:hypothetical protein